MTLKVRSHIGRSRSFRPRVSGLFAIGFAAFLSPASGYAFSCDQIATMREQLRNANSAIAAQQAGNAAAAGNEDFESEEQGCLNEYIPNTGLGLPGFGELLDGLKDAACDAANAYIGSQVKALSLSVTAPMGLGSLDIGLGEDKCAKLTDPAQKAECKKNQKSFEVTEEKIGVDYDSIFDRIEEDMPKTGNRFDKKYDYSGDKKVGDYYLDKGRSQPSSYGSSDSNSSSGGRR